MINSLWNLPAVACDEQLMAGFNINQLKGEIEYE